MLFFTIVLLTYRLYLLVRGNIVKDMNIKLGELELDKAVGIINEKEYNEKSLPILLPILLIFIPLYIIEVVYLFKAINIDVYLYPTLFVVFYYIFHIVFSKKNKNDLTTKEGRIEYKARIYSKKVKIKSIFNNIIFVSYYSYMIYLLVLLGR